MQQALSQNSQQQQPLSSSPSRIRAALKWQHMVSSKVLIWMICPCSRQIRPLLRGQLRRIELPGMSAKGGPL